MATRKVVSGSVVRAWLNEQDGQTVGARGRLSRAQVDAFHAANKGQRYDVGGPEQTLTVKTTVTGKDGRVRPTTRKVTVSEARVLTGAEGKRGRINRQNLATALAK